MGNSSYRRHFWTGCFIFLICICIPNEIHFSRKGQPLLRGYHLNKRKGAHVAKSAMIRARIEPRIKIRAEALLKKMGLNATDAVTLLYHQIIIKGCLPFEVIHPKSQDRSKVSNFSTDALIRQTRAMTPNDRLKAFTNHSYLVEQLRQSRQRSPRHAG
jgi:addiction module RelB/DinJ family antitoxin